VGEHDINTPNPRNRSNGRQLQKKGKRDCAARHARDSVEGGADITGPHVREIDTIACASQTRLADGSKAPVSMLLRAERTNTRVAPVGVMVNELGCAGRVWKWAR
jgi:hypothetical protein